MSGALRGRFDVACIRTNWRPQDRKGRMLVGFVVRRKSGQEQAGITRAHSHTLSKTFVEARNAHPGKTDDMRHTAQGSRQDCGTG